MRLMSFSMTLPQMKAEEKDVTRRYGHWNAKAGDKYRAVEKSMGLKKGESVKDIYIIEIVSARAEPLRALTEDIEYGLDEMRREGYPFGFRHPADFVRHMSAKFKKNPDELINRLEIKRVKA